MYYIYQKISRFNNVIEGQTVETLPPLQVNTTQHRKSRENVPGMNGFGNIKHSKNSL
jgi:hypothetical protein